MPVKPEYVRFARMLRAAMDDRGMNASALAKAIWGTVPDPRGYSVAKNRDRIGAYLAGTGYPSRETLVKLCEATGLKLEDLPEPKRSTAPREFAGQADVTINILTEPVGYGSLYVRRVLRMETIMEIVRLINEDAKQDEAGDGDGDETAHAG